MPSTSLSPRARRVPCLSRSAGSCERVRVNETPLVRVPNTSTIYTSATRPPRPCRRWLLDHRRRREWPRSRCYHLFSVLIRACTTSPPAARISWHRNARRRGLGAQFLPCPATCADSTSSRLSRPGFATSRTARACGSTDVPLRQHRRLLGASDELLGRRLHRRRRTRRLGERQATANDSGVERGAAGARGRLSAPAGRHDEARLGSGSSGAPRGLRLPPIVRSRRDEDRRHGGFATGFEP